VMREITLELYHRTLPLPSSRWLDDPQRDS